MRLLFLDTETTGLPKKRSISLIKSIGRASCREIKRISVQDIEQWAAKGVIECRRIDAKNLDLKKVKMLPDANMEFTKAMDMVTDRSAAGMGQRSKRYSIYVKNKTIEKMFVDADGKFDVSDSNTMISFLKSQK